MLGGIGATNAADQENCDHAGKGQGQERAGRRPVWPLIKRLLEAFLMSKGMPRLGGLVPGEDWLHDRWERPGWFGVRANLDAGLF